MAKKPAKKAAPKKPKLTDLVKVQMGLGRIDAVGVFVANDDLPQSPTQAIIAA